MNYLHLGKLPNPLLCSLCCIHTLLCILVLHLRPTALPSWSWLVTGLLEFSSALVRYRGVPALVKHDQDAINNRHASPSLSWPAALRGRIGIYLTSILPPRDAILQYSFPPQDTSLLSVGFLPLDFPFFSRPKPFTSLPPFRLLYLNYYARCTGYINRIHTHSSLPIAYKHAITTSQQIPPTKEGQHHHTK